MDKLKIKKEVWAVHSSEFGGYDYVAKDQTVWNIDQIENDRVYLWQINGLGTTLYKQVNIYEFKQTYKEVKK